VLWTRPKGSVRPTMLAQPNSQDGLAGPGQRRDGGLRRHAGGRDGTRSSLKSLVRSGAFTGQGRGGGGAMGERATGGGGSHRWRQRCGRFWRRMATRCHPVGSVRTSGPCVNPTWTKKRRGLLRQRCPRRPPRRRQAVARGEASPVAVQEG
jgi:hypothetical protein